MEANKLVKRTVYPEVPLRVEYELTAITRELDPIIELLKTWGTRHKKMMELSGC
jgi:DNA-binding HxlR family transcriptional regulator